VTDRTTGEPLPEAPPSTGAPDEQQEAHVATHGQHDDRGPQRGDQAESADGERDAAEGVEQNEPEAGEPEAGDDVPASEEDELTAVQRALAERTTDLQRLQAEYLNYKRRVERDRELVRENATYAALAPIVDVLDTIDRARDSARSLGSDLDEGFQAVAEQLERVVTKAGLVKYGEVGDPFDPRLHEALSHIGEDPEVEATTCKIIAKAGYRIGDRVVRAAQVLVVDPVSS
jgi:molecular chaperone GrpE